VDGRWAKKGGGASNRPKQKKGGRKKRNVRQERAASAGTRTGTFERGKPKGEKKAQKWPKKSGPKCDSDPNKIRTQGVTSSQNSEGRGGKKKPPGN